MGQMSLKVVGDECFLPFNGLILNIKINFTFNIIHHFNFTINSVINILYYIDCLSFWYFRTMFQLTNHPAFFSVFPLTSELHFLLKWQIYSFTKNISLRSILSPLFKHSKDFCVSEKGSCFYNANENQKCYQQPPIL